ncbi:glutamate synthase [NADPH] small chain [Candidatus Termititenax persephonae]|uniref:Glutamate synthase [NADPH] small chain n=1 Tax=Candidatus Termititenax persephonae TaxID=2218525 RepID=A0A388TGX0_9BACT|nr:glutamate synthase [NADPH] small chain [Candidatus Termititenax persephonae]
MVLKIQSLVDNKRLSTQELLQAVYQGLEQGETEFEIAACGQHDIGGPLWSPKGRLVFKVTNPGQRLGSMCLDGTTIIVEGSTSADVGWLNAGGEIIVRGDGGDTAGHCAASGKIYIGGRGGTRTGSLMKHDPAYAPPELWILKNVGSFGFEFMGGGLAVVCGIDTPAGLTTLGDRACAGMVGGTVYFRGEPGGVSLATVKIEELDEQDKKFLTAGLPLFLQKIQREQLLPQLKDLAQWKKIVAKSYAEHAAAKSQSGALKDFHKNEWLQNMPGGIFGDIYADDGRVVTLVNHAADRLRIPEWKNYIYSAPCEAACPAGIPSQLRFALLRQNRIADAYKLVLEYTPFPGAVCGAVCPNPCMEACSRCRVDTPLNIKALGTFSADIPAPPLAAETGRKIAVVGAGVGGLTAAWVLRLRGHAVTVYEKDEQIGGKLFNAVSRERLDFTVLQKELERLRSIGIKFKTGTSVDKKLYQELKKDYDFVVLAIGAYQPKTPSWPGKEKILPSLDFLKKVNNGEKPKIGKRVVVIGCGNSGMDVVFGAMQSGAQEVTAIDVQQPSAFAVEIERAEALGAKLIWPAFTEAITDEGVKLNDGRVLPADTVIIAIGEVPIVEGLLDKPELTRGYLRTGEGRLFESNVYAVGDLTRLGLLVEAIGGGREAALRIQAALLGAEYVPPKMRVAQDKLALEYFSKEESPAAVCEPIKEALRCVSCGSCRDCQMCLKSCPENAITRVVLEAGDYKYVSEPKKCIGCGICAGVCPCGIWTLKDNPL